MCMTDLLESIKLGQNRCCETVSVYEIIYENNETWSVCKSCFKFIPWNRFIKKKITLSMNS